MHPGVLLSPRELHIPDGFLSAPVAAVGWLVTIAIVALALRNTRDQLGERQVPLMGVLAAAVFAGQMLNFTIPGGTSGHLLGGALVAIILGPWAAVLVMTAVIAIQALMFQDGGLLVLGFNIVNMGVLTAFTGYFVYGFFKRLFGDGRRSLFVAGFVGGWLSVMVGALATAVELILSGTSPPGIALPAMGGVHALIGIGEGLLTVFALSFIVTTRPDLITGESAPGKASARLVWIGLVLALALTLLTPFASPYLDGLESVAERTGFSDLAQTSSYEILPNYTLPFLDETGLTTIFAGMVGVLAVFTVVWLVARTVRGRRITPSSAGD
jgi:cobalt/nickel transport system permease protein